MDAAEFLFPSDLEVTKAGIKRVLIIGSCLAEDYIKHLHAVAPGVQFDYTLFNNVSDLPSIDGKTYDFQYVVLPLRHIVSDLVINFPLYLESGVANAVFEHARQVLQLMLDSALKYNRERNLLTFVANFFVPQVPVAASLTQAGSRNDFATLVRRLNDVLAELVPAYRNAYVADAEAIANSLGKRYILDGMFGLYSHGATWHEELDLWDTSPAHNAPPGGRIEPLPALTETYACQVDQLYKALWRQMECMFRTVNQIDMVKVVIFDLDDTMWRGQIAEHYADGAAWPQAHGWPLGVWEAVHHLRARGIVTAICSKNDEGLVRARWERAAVSSWISLDHFALKEINWRPKAENIANILKAASLRAKSCVFVDDNPVERGAVKAAFPDIRTIGANPHLTKRILLWSPETQLAARSAETANREASIRQMQLRETDRTTLSREEFLSSLGCSVTIKEIAQDHPEFQRSIELLNKTNQFNTTGIRWNVAQIGELYRLDARLFNFTVADKYSNYGVVGVVIYRAGVFAQFAMSCRVLGLEIETSVLHAIMARLAAEESRGEYYGRVIDTDANMVSRDIYTKSGFGTLEGQEGTFVWRQSAIPAPAAHLKLEFAPEEEAKAAA
jgi:FkbH-like protein